MVKARQIAGILEDKDVTSFSEESDEDQPSVAMRIQTKQSPYINMFYDHHKVRLTIDSGATTGNMIRASTAKRVGVHVTKSSQSAHQADGSSPLSVLGETCMSLIHGHLSFVLEGLVARKP